LSKLKRHPPLAILMPTLNVPRLPIFGWSTIQGGHAASLPSVLDIPSLVWTSSGRAAIAFALREMRVGVGDRILVPTYHCPTMVAPIVAAGAQPLFYPISASGAPLLDRIAAMDLSAVRGMIAAHYFGLPQPMKSIREFCDQRGISLIEDCAHAMFGKADGQAIGTWGDFAIASLTKFFPVLEGGCLVSSRHRLREAPTRPRTLRDELRNGIDVLETAVQFRRLTGLNTVLSAIFSVKGMFRSRAKKGGGILSGDSVKVPDVMREGLSSFEKNSPVWSSPNRGTRWLATHANRERIIALRRRNYQLLAQKLADIPGATPLFPVLVEGCAPYVFPLAVDNPDRYYQRLRASGVPVFRWDLQWPDTPREDGDTGTLWSHQIFQIGCHQDLGLDDIDAIVNTIKGLLRDASFE
jgi:perosamine synthetase